MRDKEIFVITTSILILVGMLSIGGHPYWAGTVLIAPFLLFLTYMLLKIKSP